MISSPIDDDDEGGPGSVVVQLPPRSPPNVIIITKPDPSTFPSGQDEIRSTVVDVSLANPLPDGSFNAEICLEVERTDGESKDDLCLGFFNEEKRRWECQDSCLERNNTARGREVLCGKTDHFTSFAILLAGGSVEGSGCGGDSYLYVTGTWKGDSGLVGALILLMIVIGVILIGLSQIKALNLVFYGKEGTRIRNIRDQEKNFL